MVDPIFGTLEDGDLFWFNLDTFIAMNPRSDEAFIEKMKKSSRIIEFDEESTDEYGGIYFRWRKEEQDGIWPIFHFYGSIREFVSRYTDQVLDGIQANMMLLEDLW
jgi:hypothetical protein